MRNPFPLALLGLVLILTTLGSSSAASNKAETPDAPASTEAPRPVAEPTPIASEEPDQAENGAAESVDPAGVPESENENSSPAEEPAAAPESPEPSEAGRPELPALDEQAELDTVREDSTPAADHDVSEATLAFLRELETRHASVTAVRGEFDQLKVSEIFLEEIRSRGTFWFKKPDLFRCDYEPPDEMTNLIREDAIYVYVPELEQCEIYRFTSDQERDQQLHSMVLGFGFKTADLVDAYQIQSSEDPGALREDLTQAGKLVEESGLIELVPRPALADTSPFTRLKLWIDKDRLLPEKVWFEDYNGDQTTLEIREIELNAAVDPELFVPSFPRGTEYIDKTES